MKDKSMTGAQFKLQFKQLCESLKDNDTVTFSGGRLTFNRTKARGSANGVQSVDIEFNEVFSIIHDPSVAG